MSEEQKLVNGKQQYTHTHHIMLNSHKPILEFYHVR